MKWPSLIALSAGLCFAQGVKLPAELAPYQKVAVTARVQGVVEQVLVDRGSNVRQGDLLVELSAPEMKAQVAEVESRAQAIEAQRAEARARIVAAESTLARLTTAAATPGAVAANDIVQARQQVDALKASLAAIDKSAAAARSQAQVLRELQSFLRITAPFPGVVTSRLVHPGALASPSSGPLLELEQVSRLRLVLAVPESEIRSFPVGLKVTFSVPSWPGRTFSGMVARSSRSLDPKSRTMPVEADVVNADGALAPGMYAEVALPAKK
jgi:membrane fusion protein, multidrug efflux system